MKAKKVEKVYITLRTIYATVKDEGMAIVVFMSLSPKTINQRLKFGIISREEQASFDELREYFKDSCFKRGDKLGLFFVNQETGQKQNFWLDISKDWPKGLAEDTDIQRRESYEITSYLESIGIF